MSTRPSRLPSAWKLSLLLAAVIVPLICLYFFAPDQHPFYPRCFFFRLTGWQCPGCGALRAAHQLLHGNIAAAFRLNELLVILLPVVGGGLVGGYFYYLSTGRLLPNWLRHPIWIWTLLAVILAFGIWRNM